MKKPANRNGRRPSDEETPEPQIGASDRGPAELDQAKANRGLPKEALVSGPNDERPLASGRTEDEELEADEESEPAGASKPALRREPRTRPAEEDERRAEAESPQPGGDRTSESERPTAPGSRCGKGPGPDGG